jgi:hypothetical protein
MKNLLVPAAIAISGLFVVNLLENRDSLNGVDTSIGKHDYRHHSHLSNHEVASTEAEIPANKIKVASFASITETVMPTFFIDFSDAQTALADAEINNQMELNLVQISLPDTNNADAEINENFTAK